VASFFYKRNVLAPNPVPHNIPLACIGGSLLWMGWYGFNAGSSIIAKNSSYALLNTQASSITSLIVWMIMGYFWERKISIVLGFNGAIAGLAGITGASGLILDRYAMLFGFLTGVLSYVVSKIRECLSKKRILDDTLDVFAIHGISGAIGSILIGAFASKTVYSNLKYEGSWELFGFQTFAVFFYDMLVMFFYVNYFVLH